MSLPFVRQYPGGRRVLSEVSLFPAIENLGQYFIASGGKYLCEILPNGQARLAACLLIEGEQRDVEVEVVDNGPMLMDAVNRLVGNSVTHVPRGTKH